MSRPGEDEEDVMERYVTVKEAARLTGVDRRDDQSVGVEGRGDGVPHAGRIACASSPGSASRSGGSGDKVGQSRTP